MEYRTNLRIHNIGISNSWEASKKCLKSLVIREMQIKTTLRFLFTAIRMAKIKTSGDSTCWIGCRGRGNSFIIDGIVNWYNHSENQSGVWSINIENRSTWRPSNTTLGNMPKKFSTMSQWHTFHYVHRGLICDRQKLEATQISLDRRMDTENVVHLLIGILLRY